MYSVEELTRLDYSCVLFGVERFESTPYMVVMQGLSSMDIAVCTIDGNLVVNELALFQQLSVAMRFPDYFGMNWNAVDECLRDLEWFPAAGYVLIIENAETAWKASPLVLGALVSSWLFAATDWHRQGKPFTLVFLF